MPCDPVRGEAVDDGWMYMECINAQCFLLLSCVKVVQSSWLSLTFFITTSRPLSTSTDNVYF